jgi:short-subunit dehydrogenase
MADKVALVTGASSGIGFSMAVELAARQYDLIVCSSSERIDKAAEEMRGYGVDVLARQADLATRQGVDELWNWVKASRREIDIACLNAGVGVGGLFHETNLEDELRLIELNCTCTVQLAKYVVRDMVARHEGRILFTSSIVGEMVAPREAVYAATKAFLLSFAHSLRYELKDCGVTVTTLQPGPTDTEFFERAGLEDTKVGRKGKKENQPDRVAREGIEALLAGKDHVYSESMKTKLEGMLANVIPGRAKAAMHEKQTKPLKKAG